MRGEKAWARLGCTLALLAILGAGAAAAEETTPLQSARDAVFMLEHKEALKHLDKALDDPNLPPSDRVTAHWLTAVCYQALGRKKDTAEQLDKLLALYPLYEPKEDGVSDELIKVYQGRAKKYREDHLVTLGEPAVADGVVTVIAEKNEKEIAGARLLYRAKGETAYQEAPLTVEEKKISGPLAPEEFRTKAAASGGVEYVVQTLTTGRMPNGTAGTEAQPRLLELQAPKAAEEKKAEAATASKTEGGASGGAGGKALGVGGAMVGVGLVTGLPALAFTVVGAVLFGVGVLQVQAANATKQPLPPSFELMRITGNTMNVLGPAMGIASVTLLAFGVLVMVLLR